MRKIGYQHESARRLPEWHIGRCWHQKNGTYDMTFTEFQGVVLSSTSLYDRANTKLALPEGD